MSSQVLNAISIGKQTVWGTPVAPTVSVPVNFTGGIQINQDVQLISSLRTKLAKNLYAQKGNASYEGSFELPLLADNVGHFLYSWFGNLVTTGAGPYVHTFNEAAEKIAYTIEQNLQDLSGRFFGSIVNTLKFSVSNGAPIVVMAEIKAKGFNEVAAITPAYSDLAAWRSDTAEVKVGGVTIATFQSCEVELVNNLEYKYAIGGDGEPQYKYTTGSEVNISMEGYFDSAMKTNVWDKFKNMDEVEFVLTMNGPSSEVLVITCPKVVLTTTETPIAEDYNKISVEAKAIFDGTTDKLVHAALTNSVVSY